jgi:hypothetical protein
VAATPDVTATDRPASPLDRVERDPASGVDVLPDRVLGGCEVAGRDRLDDAAVLGDEVLVALDVAAADHLHHEVHRQLAVEAREQRVPREVDLVLVERRVRGIPLLVRDRRVGCREQLGEAVEVADADGADRTLGREQLQREPDVVSLRDCLRGHGRDVVAASRPDGQETFGDETGQRMVDGAPRDAELRREDVQAELRAGRLPARQDARSELFVDALVEVPHEHRVGHRAGPNMSRASRQPAATLSG